MTTPTPLRELPAQWRSEACAWPADATRAALNRCASGLEAALAARQDAGAVDEDDPPFLREPLPVPTDIMEARAQGRAEALAILLGESAEDFPHDYMGDHPIGDTGDYGTHWLEDKLRDLLRADNSAWSLMQAAEGEYWHNIGLRESFERQPLATPPAASGELERWGFPDGIHMPAARCADGYWTPWHIATARLAAVAPAGMDGWQPIATAPKDGETPMLFWDARFPECRPFIGYRGADFPDDAACDIHSVACYPTHWHPLPTPPAQEHPND